MAEGGERRIRAFVINFQSICNKEEGIEDILNERGRKPPDVVIGCETWEPCSNGQISIKGYETAAQKVASDGYGGVIILVRSDKIVEYTEIEVNSRREIAAARIKIKGYKPLLVIAVYRRPNSTLAQTKNIYKAIKDTIRGRRSTIWVAGDFNLPAIDWENIDDDDEAQGDEEEEIINISRELGLRQVVKKPTRGENILDLFFTSQPIRQDRRLTCTILDGPADHHIVCVDSSLEESKSKGLYANRHEN